MNQLVCPPPNDSRRADRRKAMIEAAEALFFEQGYEQTSLAAIVKRSGGSLATLYELFGNKQGLLRAMMEQRRYDLFGDKDGMLRTMMEQHHADNGFSEGTVSNISQTKSSLLRRYAHELYAYMTAREAIALKRIAITEALRDPVFASQLYEDIHLPAVRELAAYFAEWNGDGSASIDDPLAAAELFFASLISDAQIRIMSGSDGEFLTTEQIDWRLRPFLTFFKIR